MSFTRSSVKLCIPVTVFYYTVLTSKCQADDIPDYMWKHGDESIRIYKTEVPWTPIKLDTEKNTFAIVAWTAVLSVAVSVAAILCLCCLCWKLYPKYSSRRQSSTAVLVPSRRSTVVEFPADHSADRRMSRNSRRGNSLGIGDTNLSFTSSLHPDPIPLLEDGPPEYSTVISQTSLDNGKPTNTPYPPVCETKIVETPPPAYITVAPFR